MGASVTAIDTSSEAVSKTGALAEHNDVDSRVRTLLLDANRLRELGEEFDLVVGRFVLHHIAPFDEFSRALSDTISGNGRGMFLENNSRNPVLMLTRRFLVSRFGIPKYGDAEESPFDPEEIETLRRSFEPVNIFYPEFMFFQLAGSYVFKQKKGIMETLLKADDLVFRHVPVLHKYSYRQIIEVSHA